MYKWVNFSKINSVDSLHNVMYSLFIDLLVQN